MAKVINLGGLVPEDVVFDLGHGRSYSVPGDLPLERILTLARIVQEADEAGSTDEQGMDMLERLNHEALSILRIRQPDLEESPFGVIGVQHFVAALMDELHRLAGEEPGSDEDPPKATTKTSPARRRASR